MEATTTIFLAPKKKREWWDAISISRQREPWIIGMIKPNKDNPRHHRRNPYLPNTSLPNKQISNISTFHTHLLLYPQPSLSLLVQITKKQIMAPITRSQTAKQAQLDNRRMKNSFKADEKTFLEIPKVRKTYRRCRSLYYHEKKKPAKQIDGGKSQSRPPKKKVAAASSPCTVWNETGRSIYLFMPKKP